ncbi:hypothetical protein J4443_03025 [Candidatus Woesearchaeota archaeon]|nr:hypothetical protein [Candidatus Woesearchaeota archaeon]
MITNYEDSGTLVEEPVIYRNEEDDSRDIDGVYERLRRLSYLALYHVIGDNERAERIRVAMRKSKFRYEERGLASKL